MQDTAQNVDNDEVRKLSLRVAAIYRRLTIKGETNVQIAIANVFFVGNVASVYLARKSSIR